MLILLVLVSLLIRSADSSFECPKGLPQKCVCYNGGESSIHCNSVPFTEVLPHLEGLDLHHLSLQNCFLPTLDITLPLNSLKELKIERCGLRNVTNKAWKRIAFSLRELNLRQNEIESIKDLSLESLKRVSMIDVGQNKVKTLSHLSLPYLERLYLSNNMIDSIESDALSQLPMLKSFSLDNNRLARHVLRQLSGTGNITHLSLGFNGLTSEDLEDLAEKDLHSVEYLILYFNNITYLSVGSLAKLDKLHHLDLSSNNLSHISREALARPPRTFYISDNPLVCDREMQKFVMWAKSTQFMGYTINVDSFYPSAARCAAPPELERFVIGALGFIKFDEDRLSNLTSNSSMNSISNSTHDGVSKNMAALFGLGCLALGGFLMLCCHSLTLRILFCCCKEKHVDLS